MEVCRRSSWLLPLLGVILFAEVLQAVQDEVEIEGPSESECRPYIEKALKELEHVATEDVTISNEAVSSIDNIRIDEDRSDNEISSEQETKSQMSQEIETASSDEVEQPTETGEKTDENSKSEEFQDTVDETKEEAADRDQEMKQSQEDTTAEQSIENKSEESIQDKQPEEMSLEEAASIETASIETVESIVSTEQQTAEDEISVTPEETTQEETNDETLSAVASDNENDGASQTEISDENETKETIENQSTENNTDSQVDDASANTEDSKTVEATSGENEIKQSGEDDKPNEETEEEESKEKTDDRRNRDKRSAEDSDADESVQQDEGDKENQQDEADNEHASITESEQITSNIETTEKESSEKKSPEKESSEKESSEKQQEREDGEKNTSNEGTQDAAPAPSSENEGSESKESEKEDKNEENISTNVENESKESVNKDEILGDTSTEKLDETKENEQAAEETQDDASNSDQENVDEAPEEDLTILMDIPKDLRPRDHVEQLLKIDREATKTEEIIDRISEITLRDLKRLYESAIKPLETLYKYRDLSNRHYGDAEIFSKPLILFMGPWSGGKSTIINYLLNIEYNDTALQTGAEPSPAYFNLLMHGEEKEILDGTQLAADYTFSGLQKFGQGLEERLRGVKLPNKLLEKVNFVEIPGILEVRKQVSRVFPFNDACQWFIDRADIIFLVYDPSKLDVGPETEAILDQLKGREYQTRIVLNKADLVKPEELMRVQGALIWNISPLMSSPQPPVMYTTSLWSRPYEQWAPVRLLQAQERAFLRDLRTAIDRRIENKIASARRFAVRVRNHAKMVDCYLTTYYNHKSIFGNKKKVSDEIIEHPQDYHIYEGLSTLTNISRYDLPDPDVYKDFFRLNPLYEFQQLAATCTYFRGCPINKLDVAIAYDLPELVGKHKRNVEAALAEINQDQPQGS